MTTEGVVANLDRLIADQAHCIARQATVIALNPNPPQYTGAVGDNPSLVTARLLLANTKTLVEWLEQREAAKRADA